jgi:SAM-dependent methyltransferase
MYGLATMKTRESGMPSEKMWQSFFDPEPILKRLGLAPTCRDVVEFGCGYGTFTIPAARIASAVVYALDIEPEMIELVRRKATPFGAPHHCRSKHHRRARFASAPVSFSWW